MATQKQIEANRANAQLSSGPVTPEGRATSSHNAVKNGLTGQTVLLKTDDVALYNTHVQYYVDKFQPADQDERLLVQDLADTQWRLHRIPSLEAGIYAVGRLKLAPLVAHETDPEIRQLFLEAEVCLAYRKDLSNLSLQHGRLRRHLANISQELDKLQSQRKNAAERNVRRAAEYYLGCLQDPDWHFNPADLGFVFSLDEMFLQIAAIQARAEGDEFPAVTVAIRANDLKQEYAAAPAGRRSERD